MRFLNMELLLGFYDSYAASPGKVTLTERCFTIVQVYFLLYDLARLLDRHNRVSLPSIDGSGIHDISL